jgi:hypothetical protein
MTDLSRHFATEILHAQAKALDWQVQQSKVFEKQLFTGFEALRAAAELSRDLSQKMGHTVVDAMMPKGDAAKA